MATPDNKLSFAVKNIFTSIYKILPLLSSYSMFCFKQGNATKGCRLDNISAPDASL